MDPYDVFLTLSVICISLAVYFHYRIFTFWSRRGVSGPIPWPIFGTNIYYLLYNKIEMDLYWKKKYGRTFGLYEGYSPQLRTTDADVTKQLFIKKFHSVTDRNHKFVHGERIRRWLFFSLGDLWANQRALISPMFSAAKMRHTLPAMSDCVDRFIAEVDRRRQLTANDCFDKFDMSSLTLDVIASGFFGLKLNTYTIKDKQDEFITRAYKFADFRITRFISWLLIPRQVARWLKYDAVGPQNFVYFYTLGQKIIDQRRAEAKNPNAPKRQDVIQHLMDAKLPDVSEKVYSELDNLEAHFSASKDHKELDDDLNHQKRAAKLFRQFSDSEVCGQITFMMIAGFETTASTLSFCLRVLAHEIEVKEKLLNELRETFGKRGEKLHKEQDDNDGDKYTTLLSLRQLDSFLSEVLRLYSPVIEHHRMVTDQNGVDIQIDDGKTIHLPQGVTISVNPFVIHRDNQYHEDADNFDLSRFYPENREKIKAGTFVPFGLGPRHCVGMRFALLEIKLALARLLLRYDVLPVKGVAYPPKFRQNVTFLQFDNTSFKLIPREP